MDVFRCAYCSVLDPDVSYVTREHRDCLACFDKPLLHRERTFYRKDHYKIHVRSIHRNIPLDGCLATSHFSVDSNFDRRCGFCRHQFSCWKDRIKHIGKHFEDGKDMLGWDRHYTSEETREDDNQRIEDEDEDGDPTERHEDNFHE